MLTAAAAPLCRLLSLSNQLFFVKTQCLRFETKLTNETILRPMTPSLSARLAGSSFWANQDHLCLYRGRVHRRALKGSEPSNVRVHNRLSDHSQACGRCTLPLVARLGCPNQKSSATLR